jgi:type 1 glutamine amidotransferase
MEEMFGPLMLQPEPRFGGRKSTKNEDPITKENTVRSRRLRIIKFMAAAVIGLWGSWSSAAADEDAYDQSKVPLEVQPTDPSLTKIALIAGRQSHGPGEHEFFAGCALLMKVLQQTPGVFPVMARDGWPKDPTPLENARALVFFMDGGGGHPIIKDKHLQEVQKVLSSGAGFVNLHYAVEYPKQFNKPVLDWLGGYYETGYSINPHWKANFKTLPNHPITRGVKPFNIQDEWYYNMRFPDDMKGVTPILKATPPDNTRRTEAAKSHPGREEILAWAFERSDGGRSFGFTGGHFHRNWDEENFRRLVINAILWTAKLDVPPEGARVRLDPDDIKKNLDRKAAKKPANPAPKKP